MKRKIVKKLSKEQKSLLIGLLLGDGTISNNYVFKLSHSTAQYEFLEWKLKQLNESGIKNNGIKTYISKCGYNTGFEVLYSQLSINPTIKALRRTVYIPKKKITRKLLNWLTPREIAIWFMDDGMMNINSSKQRNGSIQHSIKFATCVDFECVEEIIKYFKEEWDIKFMPFKEGKETWSIRSSSEIDTINFIKIIKPYILQVPSLLYKIRNNYTKEQFLALQEANPEVRDIIY